MSPSESPAEAPMTLAKRKPAPTTPSISASEPVYGAIHTEVFPYFAWIRLKLSAMRVVASSQLMRCHLPDPRSPTRL